MYNQNWNDTSSDNAVGPVLTTWVESAAYGQSAGEWYIWCSWKEEGECTKVKKALPVSQGDLLWSNTDGGSMYRYHRSMLHRASRLWHRTMWLWKPGHSAVGEGPPFLEW